MDSPLRERIARALMNVVARLPGNLDDREFPVLALDPDYDDLPRDHTEGTIDDQITQDAVLRLADAAISTLTLSDHIAAVEASGTHYVEQRRVDEYPLPDTEGPTEAEWAEMRAWAVRSDLKGAIEKVEAAGYTVTRFGDARE